MVRAWVSMGEHGQSVGVGTRTLEPGGPRGQRQGDGSRTASWDPKLFPQLTLVA